MKIGELAGRTGLTPSRIRFYERIGLLKTVRRQANGYRTYPPEAVDMLMLITTAQQAGFSLQELRALLPADLTSWDHGALLEALHQKVREIEAIQERLAASKARLPAGAERGAGQAGGHGLRQQCPTGAVPVRPRGPGSGHVLIAALLFRCSLRAA